MAKKDITIVTLAFLAVIASMSGWMVFDGVRTIFNLEDMKPLTLILLGLGVAWAMYKLGLNNVIKRR